MAVLAMQAEPERTGRAAAGEAPLRRTSRAGLAAALLLVAGPAGAVTVRDSLSAWNSARPLRPSTDYIVLHTTEAPSRSSLNSLRAYGEAHYMVDPRGIVYRLLDRRRVATHAGRSMWNGRTNLDDSSLGIEVVGYHDREITAAQYTALRELLDELQAIYRLPDEKVLTHSMVAYGTPNRWCKRSHRGRKRCGMLFNTSAVRARLGLSARASSDPDVRAGRLIVGDAYLAKVLYGASPVATPVASATPVAPATTTAATVAAGASNVIGPGRSAWDVARDRYRSPDVIYQFPDGTRLRGSQVRDWDRIPAGTRVIDSGAPDSNVSDGIQEIGPQKATDIAGAEAGLGTTFYFLPDHSTFDGSKLTTERIASLPSGTRVLVGYRVAGTITRSRPAFEICGTRWSAQDTYYRSPDGRLTPGDKTNPKTIAAGTVIYVPN